LPSDNLAGIDRYLENLDHETLLVRRGRRSGLYTIVAVHSTARGPSLGGCRMWTYGDSRAALRDALRLSRAMTLKSAVAGLPLGGGKGVIMLPAGHAAPAGEARRDVLLDFGETVDALGGAYVTAEDVGTSDRDMAVIAEVTGHVAGLAVETGGSGDPSPWTALGVLCAMEVACERAFGTASLSGRTVSVVGLGRVGGKLARMLAEAGAELTVSDVDDGRRALADELGAHWTDPDSAMLADVDVVAPCALGAVLDDESVPALRCRVIAGAANNQLAADPIAVQLAERDIVWAPDFVANAGGIINIAVELEGTYDQDRAEANVRRVADTTREVFDHADASGATPLAAAIEIARRRLAEAPAPRAAA
jgi:leucine dehydrogenase